MNRMINMYVHLKNVKEMKELSLGNAEKNKLIYRASDNRYYADDCYIQEDMVNCCTPSLAGIVEPGSSVLDVGCAQGVMGRLLKNKYCKVYGIEINAEALKDARESKNYVDVFDFNIENPVRDSEEYQKYNQITEEFDYIVLSNVLEHLVNPSNALIEVSRKLKNGGRILVSMPNVAHADIVLNLLNGIFNYNDMGLLDNSHLRFFTKSSFLQWIEDFNDYSDDVNFDCEYIGGVSYDSDYTLALKSKRSLFYSLLEANPDFNVLQHDFILIKRDKGTVTPMLEALLHESSVNSVAIMENALKGVFPVPDAVDAGKGVPLFSLCRGERELYEQRVKALESKCNELESKCNELEFKRNELEFKHNELEFKRNDLEFRRSELERKYNEETANLNNARSEIEKIKNSRSWKLMQPLRSLRSHLK